MYTSAEIHTFALIAHFQQTYVGGFYRSHIRIYLNKLLIVKLPGFYVSEWNAYHTCTQTHTHSNARNLCADVCVGSVRDSAMDLAGTTHTQNK